WAGSVRSNSHLAIPNYLFSPVAAGQPSMSPAARFPSSGFDNGGTTVQFSDRGEVRHDAMATPLCSLDPLILQERCHCSSPAVNRKDCCPRIAVSPRYWREPEMVAKETRPT